MIKNIVFDIGQVLLTFEPEKYLQKYFDNHDKIESLAQVTFHSEEWLKLDRGEWEIQQAGEFFSKKYPDFSEVIKQAIFSWTDMLKPITGTINLLKEVKATGYNTYALSNFPDKGFNQVESIYNFWDNFDGMVISAKEGYIKPEPELYKILLQRYNLQPEETLFIDDSQENIAGAKRVGMKGIVFNNPEKLKEQLSNYNIF